MRREEFRYIGRVSDLEFRFIGTGNAFAPGGLCWNGFVVNERYLFEAPPSALMVLNRIGVEANTIEAVLLSHHHGDHFLGLPSLLLHWKYMGRQKPVSIVGPPGTQQLAKLIGEAVYPGLLDVRFDIHWIAAQPGRTLRVADMTVEPVEVLHDDRLDVNLGYQCEIGGRRFGYTGDTAYCDAVADLARHSEVLVSECASVDDAVPIHMNLKHDIPKVRAAMRKESLLLLTHLGPGVSVSGNGIQVAEDLGVYRR